MNKLPIPDDSIHLSNEGYSLKKSDQARKNALKKSAKKYGSLTVMRRVNLIRNITSVPSNKKKLSKDVDYLKGVYSREKKRKSKSKLKK